MFGNVFGGGGQREESAQGVHSVQSRRGASAAPGPAPVPLIVRSAYSLARGTALPSRLLDRARAHGYDRIALTDRDNLYGAVAFLRAADERSIAPILGAEVTPRAGPPAAPGEEGIRGGPRGPCEAPGAAILLVREPAGYASLCRILTARHLAPAFDLVDAIARDHAGLAVLARDADLLDRLAAAAPGAALYGAITRPAASRAAEQALRDAARRHGAPLVGTVDAYLAEAHDAPAHALLAAIRENELVTRLAPDRTAPPGRHLADPAGAFRLFADDPALLAAARELAASCDFTAADLPAPGSLFPKLPLPDGESAYDRLYRMTQDGLRRRYRRVTPEVGRRLSWELEQIDGQGFTDYFVVVGDLVAAARARGIPTVGRGSGASSLVSYLLGITNVDPVRYRLTFERFLHRLRRDLPDLDVDICWRRRDEVINHVYETYGADRVAMISTHNHYQARGAFREAAKGFGLPPERIDRIARAIPSFHAGPFEAAIRSTPLGKRVDLAQPPLPELVAAVDGVLGLPHTLGIHCGGIVIGPGPLDAWVPLEQATKGIVVTQYEMRAVEAVGLVKIDLLGNRALSTIAETCAIIRTTGAEPPPDLDAIPDPDPAASQLLVTGDTLGCFQLESPGMRNLLKMLRTDDLAGGIAALSLIRPGPAGSGMKDRFIRRARGEEPTVYLHPSLEPLLASTHGVLLYEEDVICVASEIGGFDRAVGDLLRRAIAAASAISADPALGERPTSSTGRGNGNDPWRGLGLRALENRFIESAVRNRVDADIARAVWAELARFGSYAFCKAHASGYGILAYQSVYLKAHHPGPFYAALMNNHQGMYPKRVHLEDARRHGVAIAPPCVHASQAEWTWDGARLRCGLAQVRGLSARTIDTILARRGRDGFADLDEFLALTKADAAEARALVLCGALDAVPPRPRPAKLWRLACVARAGGLRDNESTARLAIERADSGAAPEAAPGPWREFDRATCVRREIETLDLAITAHPVAVVCEELAAAARLPRAVPAANLADHDRAAVLGILSAARRVPTKQGESMAFLTLEDASGLAECTLFPPVFAREAPKIRGGWLLYARGKVESPHGAATLTVDSIEALGPCP